MKAFFFASLAVVLFLSACKDSDTTATPPPENVVGLWVISSELEIVSKDDLDCTSLAPQLVETPEGERILNLEVIEVSKSGTLSIFPSMEKNATRLLVPLGRVSSTGVILFSYPEIIQDVNEDAKADIAEHYPELVGLPVKTSLSLKFNEESQRLEFVNVMRVTKTSGEQVEVSPPKDPLLADENEYQKITSEQLKRVADIGRACL